jgi:hypothetical protein
MKNSILKYMQLQNKKAEEHEVKENNPEAEAVIDGKSSR